MNEKQTINPKRQGVIRKIQKVEKYSLNIGILCIFVGIWIPIANYVSTAAFALTYVTALIKQWLQNGRIKIISFILCSASLSWVVLRQFYNSPYVTLFGQVVLYSYLMVSQKELLGQVKKSFALFAVMAIGLGVLRIYYPSKLTNGLNLLMQLWILYRFLDPILGNIGQAHRRKRLAEEAERKRTEDLQVVKSTESKEEPEKETTQGEMEEKNKDQKENCTEDSSTSRMEPA